MSDETNQAENDKVYNPVTVTLNETIGVIALAIIALVLIMQLIKMNQRNRALCIELAEERRKANS